MKNQEQMIALFKSNQNSVKRYLKQGTVNAKLAIKDEKVKTEINGVVETVNTAKENDVVVQGSSNELYLINIEKFKARYNVEKELSSDFQEYKATGECFAFEFKGEGFSFIAPWAEEMIVEDGDFLASPNSEITEVYRIEKNAFYKTYKAS